MKLLTRSTSILIILLACPILVAAQAKPLTGKVVAISDGDTVTVLDATNTQYKIRFQGIDAPESRQAFGTRSKQSLSDLIFGKQVTVEWNARDRYQRILGKVLLEGRDINLEQLKADMAWYYRAYERDVAAGDRKPYSDAEAQARAAKRGLWAEGAPVTPWDFRRSERVGGAATDRGQSQPAASGETSASTSVSGNIVGNKNSRKYHLPGCPGYDQTLEKNRVYFKSAAEAEAAGFTKAGNCRK